MLLDPLDCIDEHSLTESSAASASSGDWVMEAAPDVVCLEPFHLALASTSTISAAVYLVITLRLIRVGGNLASVEFDPKSYVRQNATAVNCEVRTF